jgi:hypothetical protein
MVYENADPAAPLPGEPDLSEPGEPLEAKLMHADGTWSPLPIDQGKRDNFIGLASAVKGGVAAVPSSWRKLATHGANGDSGSLS